MDHTNLNTTEIRICTQNEKLHVKPVKGYRTCRRVLRSLEHYSLWMGKPYKLPIDFPSFFLFIYFLLRHRQTCIHSHATQYGE